MSDNGSAGMGLRASEWLSLAFFAYVAALTPFFRDRPYLEEQPVVILLLVGGVYWSIRQFDILRDWLPIAVTFLAFREMNFFRPARFGHYFEPVWQAWDVQLLRHWPFGAGAAWLLESCYFLVYGTAALGVWALYAAGERRLVDRFFFLFYAGTLGAYALFPFFPSEAPRLIYPGVMPPLNNAMRSVNLFFLQQGTIHSSVFPSAHVSSAFSVAWGLLLLLPRRRRWLGFCFLGYAVGVAVATVYGRYHYVADALAGIAVSLAAVLGYWLYSHRIGKWG